MPDLCKVEDKSSREGESKADIIISCFQIESLKETLVVYLFVAVVLALLGHGLYNLYIKRWKGEFSSELMI